MGDDCNICGHLDDNLFKVNECFSLFAPVRAVIDSNQNVVASYKYDGFGKLLSKTGTLNQPYMFSTKRYYAFGGHDYGYRFYLPAIGKWMTRDPIGEAGGVNIYRAMLNDLPNMIDPTGLIGIGLLASGSGEVGIALIGASGTTSAGGGLFYGKSEGLNAGDFTSLGGVLGGPGYGYSCPESSKKVNMVAGAFLGAGGGAFIISAKSAKDLEGNFETYTFNIGLGPKFSIQIAVSDKTWIGSITFGPGGGLSGSIYTTNTPRTGGIRLK